ncbi:trypsin-like peptidase domain-containing protein [Candidatus Peregrinibacteria bacterium]|nr:trypsin-like peptidase domain-containing protein [Candidatus Peregrinibacteria bacterium]
MPKILDRVTVWGYPNVGGGTVTVTSGFVSGFSVEEKKAGTFVKWVKTDTNINPGNSGGAVFNEHFLYAGIPSNSFLGQLGFFIPVQTAVEWLQDISKKKIIRLRDVTSLKTYAANFSDVEDEKLYDILILMKHLGLMGGAAEDLFNPDQAFTKGEAVASAMAAARRAAPFFEKPCVSAQNGDDAYRNEVCHAAEQGWISAKNFRAIDPAAESFFIDMLNKSFGKRMLRSHSDRVLSQADAAEILFGLIAE